MSQGVERVEIDLKRLADVEVQTGFVSFMLNYVLLRGCVLSHAVTYLNFHRGCRPTMQ